MKRLWEDIQSNQLFEMSKADILERQQRRSRILYPNGKPSSWYRIPATSAFDIVLSDYNIILNLLGLPRRLPNEMTFGTHSNKKMNRYMQYQVNRMYHAQWTEVNPKKFWFIADMMMKYSVAFRISAINAVFRRWYKNLPLAFVMNINQKADEIIKNRDYRLDFKRVYIPKELDKEEWKQFLIRFPNGMPKDSNVKVRPLGVPKHAWRLVLHMWSNFITAYTDRWLRQDQHAFRPAKGCLTAWKDLVFKMHKYPYVYEFDLKGCFDNISARAVSAIFSSIWVPQWVIWYMESVNRQAPKLPDAQYLDETDYINKAKYGGAPAPQQGGNLDESTKGLPQGGSTSPILANLVIQEYFYRNAWRWDEWICYADDGLIFSRKPIEMPDDKSLGIIVNHQKSRLVKEAGKWISEFIYLGLKYDPFKDTISGHTRKGSRLEFDSKRENIFELLEYIKPDYATKWQRLFTTSISGQVQSKLYNATWEDLVYSINWKPFGINGSWIKRKGLTDNFKTTSSDACCALAYMLKNRRGSIKRNDTASVTEIRKEDTRMKYRAMKVNGRWIKVLNKDRSFHY